MASWVRTGLFVCFLSGYAAVPLGKDPVRQVNFDHASINSMIMNIAWPKEYENPDASSMHVNGNNERNTRNNASLCNGNKHTNHEAQLNSSMEFLRQFIVSANSKLDQLLESGDSQHRNIIANSKTQTQDVSNKLDEMRSRLNQSDHDDNIIRAIYDVKAQIMEVLREKEDNGTDTRIDKLNNTLVRLEQSMDKILEDIEEKDKPTDCAEVYRGGNLTTGVYSVWPHGASAASRVLCQMSHSKWTVLMRRFSGSLDFNRTWTDYKFGFGNPSSDYWAGNEFMHFLTSQKNYKLRIEFKLWATSASYYAEYSQFKVAAEADNYRLAIGGESGTARLGGMDYHNGLEFSTKDRTASGSCPVTYSGGWWYKGCHKINLTGPYTNQCFNKCSRWYLTQALKEITMKVTAIDLVA